MKLTAVRTRSWRAVARVGRWLVAQASARLHNDVIHVDDPIVDMLYRALGTRTGKLRMADAFLICGLEAGKVTQDQIERFGKAIRELGWERQRRRHDGTLEYVYVRGSNVEREVELLVEYDPHMRTVRIEHASN